jgi:tetratricopeptide (TPR) repeat protein
VLADRLIQRAESVKKPARLVLLSRGSGVWWKELLLKTQSLQFLCSLGGDAYDEIKVPEHIATENRRSLFDASVNAFTPHRSLLASNVEELRPPSHNLLRAIDTDDDYDRPLAVQIAALLYVAGVDSAKDRGGMAGLLDRILGLEYAHWDKTLDIRGQLNSQTAIKNGVAQVTLVGRVGNAAAAEALIERDPLYRRIATIDVPSVRHKLGLVFPGENDGLASLEPDLIGEHHVADVATDALVDACIAWAGDDRTQRQHILTVLNRATRAEHGASASRAVAQLQRLVQTQASALGGDLVKVALETPGRLLDLCPALEAQLGGLDESALAAIDEELPEQSLTFLELSLSVARRQVDLARKLAAATAAADAGLHGHHLSRLAARLGTLGIRLFNRGRREAPLIAYPEVDGNRLAQLAVRLDILCIRLSNLGRHEEALASSQEAVEIYRRLAQTQSTALLPNLATSLINLGNRLSYLGRHEEALAASQDAVDTYRRLAQIRPEAFLSDLAAILNNLGVRLSDLGRREEALTASQEAVDIRRGLARARPDAFLFGLASSLNNLSIDLAGLGRHEEALDASQDAVDTYRRLAQTRPDAFLPDLATSLNNLGGMLSYLGRREEALAASQEGLEICQRLARSRPDVFLPELARSQNNLGIRLSNIGRQEEALAASQEGVDIYRRLARSRPDVFLPDLALGLNNLGNRLSNLGRREEALAASQEAVEIYRRLVQRRPDAFLPNLATSISVTSDVLAALERHQEAAHAATEALEILAPFVDRYPQAYERLAHAIEADILRYCKAAGQQPDHALLARIAKALDAT